MNPVGDTLAAPHESAALDPRELAGALFDLGYGPFTGVPCSYLGSLLTCLEREHPDQYVIAANEGEAVAIAAGARLAGRCRPVVVLQNSGLGNAVNPLTSLTYTLRLPVLLLVTWRGEPGRPEEPQHLLMGRITGEFLDSMEIAHEELPVDPVLLGARLAAAATHMESTTLPYAFIVRKGALGDYSVPPALIPDQSMLRAEAIGEVMRTVLPGTLVVATTGKTARELERDWDRPENLYVVGSMGCASSIGLGVALNARDRPVVVLDGDGAALMRLEAMATIGRVSPSNLLHVLLDNETHESTGGQPTGSGSIDFAGVAAACGYAATYDVNRREDLGPVIEQAQTRPGPALVRVRIVPGSDAALGRPRLAPSESAARFSQAMRA